MRKYLLIIVLLALALTGCSGSSTPSAPAEAADRPLENVSLAGNWETVEVTGSDVVMTAVISDTVLEVYWQVDNTTKGLYWKGTVPAQITDSLTFTSDADVEALSSSIFGSTSTTKQFTYENDQLKYDFTALGITQTLLLERI